MKNAVWKRSAIALVAVLLCAGCTLLPDLEADSPLVEGTASLTVDYVSSDGTPDALNFDVPVRCIVDGDRGLIVTSQGDDGTQLGVGFFTDVVWNVTILDDSDQPIFVASGQEGENPGTFREGNTLTFTAEEGTFGNQDDPGSPDTDNRATVSGTVTCG